MLPFGLAPLHVRLGVGGVGAPTGTRCSLPHPHAREPGGRDLSVDAAPEACIQMPRFGDNQGGDTFADPSGSSRNVSGKSNHNARAIPSRRDPSHGDTLQANPI